VDINPSAKRKTPVIATRSMRWLLSLTCWQSRIVDDQVLHSDRRAVPLLRQVRHLLRADRQRASDVDWIFGWRGAGRRGRGRRQSARRWVHSAHSVVTFHCHWPRTVYDEFQLDIGGSLSRIQLVIMIRLPEIHLTAINISSTHDLRGPWPLYRLSTVQPRFDAYFQRLLRSAAVHLQSSRMKLYFTSWLFVLASSR